MEDWSPQVHRASALPSQLRNDFLLVTGPDCNRSIDPSVEGATDLSAIDATFVMRNRFMGPPSLPLPTAKFSAEKADGRVRRERQGWEDGGDRNALCKLGSTNFCYKGACLGFDLL